MTQLKCPNCKNFPLDPIETLDTDGDEIGNTEDPDDDGDGTVDTADPESLDPTVDVDNCVNNVCGGYGVGSICSETSDGVTAAANTYFCTCPMHSVENS